MNYRLILKKIKPTKLEGFILNLKVKSFVNKLQKGINAEVVLGGSVAKGTWLMGNYDIDVFVRFKLKGDLSEDLWKILKERFNKIERIHGSRDYFQVFYKGLNFEVVPVLKVKCSKEIENITDISPLHVIWVKNNINDLEDEIRLAKSFCKAQEVYGAETYKKGFSGYVIELLVIKYNGFENFLKNAINWKEGEIISFFDKKVDSKNIPLFLADPVQANRNAAAALSYEKLNKFKSVARAFLNNKSKRYFLRKKILLKDVIDNNLVLKIWNLKGNMDIVGTKLLKFFERLSSLLKEEGFFIINSGWSWDEKKEALMWFSVKVNILPKFKLHKGLPLENKSDCLKFREKYKLYEIKEKNGRLYVNLPRKVRSLKEFIELCLKNDAYFLERVQSVKIVKG